MNLWRKPRESFFEYVHPGVPARQSDKSDE